MPATTPPRAKGATLSDSFRSSWLTPSMAAFALHVLLVQIGVMSGRVNISYRAIELGASALWVGLIGASFSLLPLFFATSIGKAIDHSGARGAFLSGGGFLVAAAILFVCLDAHIWVLMLGSMLIGFGHLLCLLSQHAFMAGTGGTEGMDRRFGHYTALISLGQVVGPGVIVLFSRGQSIPDTIALFWFFAIVAVLSLAATLAVRFEPVPDKAHAASAPPTGSVARMPGVMPAVIAGIAAVCAIDLLVVYLPVLGTAQGITASMVAFMLTLRALASLGARMFIGGFLRLFGRRWLISGSVALTGLGLGALVLPWPLPAMVVSVTLVGVGAGLAVPLTMSWLSGIVPARSRGLALSLRLTGNRLAQLVTPASVGVLAGALSLPAAILVVGGIVVASAVHTHRALASGSGPVA